MKFQVTMKDPDSLYQALNLDNEFTDKEREDAEKAAEKWLTYGEYITIEIDTVTGLARVCGADE